MKSIILASASPRRKKLLKRLGIKFKVEPSDYKEDMKLKLKPKALAKYLSKEKAKAVAKNHKNSIIIGADTFIVLKGKILGKPQTATNAKRMLKNMSGKPHSVITGFTIIDTKRKKTISNAIESRVYFKKLTKKEIDDYVKSREPLDKAGAYAIQEGGAAMIEKVDGDYFNVVGLPLKDLAETLKALNVKISQDRF